MSSFPFYGCHVAGGSCYDLINRAQNDDVVSVSIKGRAPYCQVLMCWNRMESGVCHVAPAEKALDGLYFERFFEIEDTFSFIEEK